MLRHITDPKAEYTPEGGAVEEAMAAVEEDSPYEQNRT